LGFPKKEESMSRKISNDGGGIEISDGKCCGVERLRLNPWLSIIVRKVSLELFGVNGIDEVRGSIP
jgi:hypothetical protein